MVLRMVIAYVFMAISEDKISDHTMKQEVLFLTAIAAAAFVVGCDKQSTTSQQINKVEAKTEKAAQEIKDYTYAQKAEYTTKMEADLADINRDLDALQMKLDKASESVKTEAQPKLRVLRDQAAELSKSLDNVKNSTESTWDSVKAGSKKAYGELKDGFNQARQWLSEKIKP